MFHSLLHHAGYKLLFKTIEERREGNCYVRVFHVHDREPGLLSWSRFHSTWHISLTLSDISKCVVSCKGSTIYYICAVELNVR
jgi:hypothetical protein